LKVEDQFEVEEEQRAQERHLWKTIWFVQVPNKIKTLMWRACRNSLPIKENLVRWTIINNLTYDHCKQALELALHAMWSCWELDVIWKDDMQWQCKRNHTFVDFKELLSWLITNQRELEFFFTSAWLIWTQRNLLRLNKTSISSH